MNQVQWTFDPAAPVPIVIITCYQKSLSLPSQRWRWRAQSQGNARKLANGGEGYGSPDGLAHALQLLWPTETTRHVVVKGLP